MEQTRQAPQPRTKYKSFTYHTHLNWVGNRAGVLHSKGKPEFRVSSPPEFKGEDGVWSPEDLFVASVDICTMTTFLAFAKHKKLSVTSYNTHAEGLLEFVEGKFRFSRIILRPSIVVETQDAVEQAKQILKDAHKGCLVSNSIKTTVVVEPNFQVVEGNGSG